MKRNSRRSIFVAAMLACCMALTACGGEKPSAPDSPDTTEVAYPTEAVTLLVPYGEGGGKDIMARGFAPFLEKALGTSIVVENKPGSSGAVGAQFVQSQAADGYYIYFGGEATETYQVMGMLDVGYDGWEPIAILNRETPTLCVNPNSQFAGMEWQEMLDYILAHPGEVTFGSTGVGSVQWNWMKLLEKVYGIELLEVSYSSGTDAITALLGGHIDIYSCGQSQVKSYLESGDLLPIVTLDSQPIDGYGCKCLGDYTDEFDSYLPYGSYVAIMAKSGTDKAIIEKLCEAAKNAYEDPEFQSFLTDISCVTPVGAFGADARAYLERQQSVTCYLLYDTGNLASDPATFGIERIQ